MCFAPPDDPLFQYLLAEAAVAARVPVWGIVVSAERLVPFDPTFHPEEEADGPAIVEAIKREWQAGRPAQPWVYPRGDAFVVSDDYFALAAIRQGRAVTVACQCLGEPSLHLVQSRMGPIPLADIRRMLGLRISD